ncbi:MAG: N-acetylglucosamine-6-phosphate deacetylase [Flavitalea sp.]
MEKKIKIFNGRILTPYRVINGTVIITGNKITSVSEGNTDAPGATVINAQGNYISPGFIDMHVHGGGGHDFMDGTEEAFLKIAELHAQYGTTSMLPTTLTSEKEGIIDTIKVYEKAKNKNTLGSEFLGMHLEGPYFAMNQRGAQDPRYIRDPDPKEYMEIVEASNNNIRRWSAAPELKGALEFCHYLRSKNILASFAHTDAIFEEILVAFENGYTLATHFYSCMTTVTRKNAYRYAGAIECAYLTDEMDVEIIADGVHLPAPLLKLIHKIKGVDRVALITDAMRAAGMPEGEYVLGNKDTGMKVIVEEGVAKLQDRTFFAGSVATADRLVRTMINKAGISLLESVRMISQTPASILGLSASKGSIIPGKDADIVIFDDDINIQKTIIGGNIVFEKKI